MKTGSYLKARRKELGLTLEKLAKSVGVTRQTLSRYENGVITNIPMDKITRLAEAMHTTPTELLGWHDVDFREYQPNQRVPILGRISAGLPLYAEEGKTGLVIAVGCTGGHHRSVAVTHALAGFIASLGYQVTENHRDMTRN